MRRDARGTEAADRSDVIRPCYLVSVQLIPPALWREETSAAEGERPALGRGRDGVRRGASVWREHYFCFFDILVLATSCPGCFQMFPSSNAPRSNELAVQQKPDNNIFI